MRSAWILVKVFLCTLLCLCGFAVICLCMYLAYVILPVTNNYSEEVYLYMIICKNICIHVYI